MAVRLKSRAPDTGDPAETGHPRFLPLHEEPLVSVTCVIRVVCGDIRKQCNRDYDVIPFFPSTAAGKNKDSPQEVFLWGHPHEARYSRC